jgi:ribosomal-protein-alanine N-acetyltransferase
VRFDDLRLCTPRLLLRPLRDADAPALHALFADPEVVRYWKSGPWPSREEALRAIRDDPDAMRAGSRLRLGVVRLADDALVGACMLFHLEWPSRRAELAYALAPSAWGRGYAGEAVGALLRHAFDTLALRRIEADADPRNTASARLLERLGFVREGLLRERWLLPDGPSDGVVYGLLRSEWAGPAARGPGRAR